ncbi:MAG: hypothetical protein IKZ43_07505 [Acidaminococcaceae bacterium]|nr:hypothetical protein [Acidaminococcaceae bacterium]
MLQDLLRSFSVFGNYANIYVGEGEQNIKYTKLANAFVQHNMIVSIAEEVGFEINPTMSTAPKAKKIMRPIIFSPNREWGITFNGERIDINWSGLSAESKIEKDDFINKAVTYLKIIEQIYQITYIRIAFNFEGVYYDFPESRGNDILNKVAATQLTLYKEKSMKEWNIQYAIVEKVSDFDRPVNLITTVSRGIRNFRWMKHTDCISFHCDCNTVIDKDSNSIIENNMAISFLKKYANLPNELSAELFK